MMKIETQLIIILVSFSFVALILFFMKKNKLREEYSLIWFFTAIIIVFSAIFAKQIVSFFSFLNPDSAGEIILFAIIISLLVFILIFSIKLSDVKNQNKIFTQEITLLKDRIKKLEKKLSE